MNNNNIPKASLVYVWGYNPVSAGIRFFQNILLALRLKKAEIVSADTPTHMEIYIGKGKCISAEPEGVRIKKLKRHKKYKVMYYKNMSVWQEEGIITFLHEQLDTGYDFKGLFAFPLRIWNKIFGKKIKRDDDDKKWFCSEICCEVYLKAGIRIGHTKEGWNVSPAQSLNYIQGKDKFAIYNT